MIASLLSLLLATASLPPVPDAGVPAAASGQVLHDLQLTPIAAPTIGSVGLHVEHGQPNGKSGPSFLLQVEGWKPNGHLSVYLIGPKGEKVDVASVEKDLQIESDGGATVLIPYKLRGLYPGTWQVLVAGESGAHMIAVEIPVVEPPNAAHKKFRLIFPGVVKGEKPRSFPEDAPDSALSR